MLAPALAAADELATAGIAATVLDLRWLRPLDDEAIAAAVLRAHGRVIVVHEASLSGGFGAEVSARITERHFSELAAPVARIGTADIRMPSAPALQLAVLPSTTTIVETAKSIVGSTVAIRVG
jgi:2-oxoisovalerate dehydrogenase E1 component